MRLIFVFFLLANASYFYLNWEGFRDGPAPFVVEQPLLPAGAERLIVLRERGLGAVAGIKVLERLSVGSGETATPGGEGQSVSVESPPHASLSEMELPVRQTPNAVACFSLGPFQQAGAAKRAAEAISALGPSVKRRQASHRRPRGYWVYLPSFKDYSAARKKVQQIQKKGVKDLFIMGKGLHKNAISLGLFNRRGAAEKRLKQVKALGLKAARVEAQYRVSKQAWLDFSIRTDQTTTVTNVTALAETLPKVSLSQKPCE